MLSLRLSHRPLPFATDAVPGLRHPSRRGHTSSGRPACATVGQADVTQRFSEAEKMPPLRLLSQPRPIVGKPVSRVWRRGRRRDARPSPQASSFRPGLHPCDRCGHPCPCSSDRLGVVCPGVPPKGEYSTCCSHRDGPGPAGGRPSGHADGSCILDAGHTYLHTDNCPHADPNLHRDTAGDGHSHADT